jgi:L-seryl-tRNA(Ser) seleniumtransferase
VKTNRRQFLSTLGAAAPVAGLVHPSAALADDETPLAVSNDFSDLGVKSFINAIGPYSSLGGAVMWPEVIDAMDYAIRNKIRMSDLQDAVGRRIAALLGANAAMVTSGATGAIILGTAACMTGGNRERQERIPDTTGMPNEVLILKSQRYLYDRSIRAPGAVLVEVETEADIRAAVNERTAMMFYLQNRPSNLALTVEVYIRLAKEFSVPIFCDAATTVPPVSNIRRTVEMGFDLVCYSGGKGLRGPYSAGLLLGREDLVRHARANGAPNHRAYGRSMKVAPEEYLGMMVAVEKSLQFDEAADFERQLELIEQMDASLSSLEGVITEIRTPGVEAREPYVEVRWDSSRYPIAVADVKQALRDGKPSVEVRALFLSDGQLHLTATMLKPGEAEIVTRRVREILLGSGDA